jgi:RNA polymerase sigma-70 factor, ECF subfamily
VQRELDPNALGDHIDRLYRAAWALCGSREEAEDLVQETFARVLRRPRLLRSEDDVGYLLRALRNTFLRERERSLRRAAPAVLEGEAEPADPRAGLRPEARVEARELYALVAELPQHFREVLVAVDVVGLSYKEAARALRLRQGTVMSRLYRARDGVAQRLG